eukprot:CAMPEP_0184683254 /NCGR_PEP_ID=MMETSP0312-20130426/10516_1 /TAXON_ID=31354 /ORGANISM="Compsopogon coeruleus, Strain SAG 36.94" /LENGTH=42 /DNA_ID= /DNA_START= /DNA_END= /DNA_ORIENTATION=
MATMQQTTVPGATTASAPSLVRVAADMVRQEGVGSLYSGLSA